MNTNNVLALALLVTLSSAQLLQPPAFTSAPPAGIVYFTSNQGDSLLLPCVAIGNPKPNYQWKKDSQILNIIPKVEGTIEIRPLTYLNAGIYQCFASNSEGVAMSNTTFAVLALQASFAESSAVRLEGTLGMPLQMPCHPESYGVPMPRNSGSTKELTWRADDSTYLFNQRIQVDDMGNLNFAYLVQDDFKYTTWECYMVNSILKVDVGGTSTNLVVSAAAPAPAKPPTIMFYTNQTQNQGSRSTVVVGLEGGNVSLRCFFSGSENIRVTWRRTDGGTIPTDGRIVFQNYIEMFIKNAQKSDEGQYACTGTASGFTSVDFPVSLYIHAAPKFVNPMTDGPRNYNASVGEYVRFNCTAQAIPNATVTWFKNGVVINPNSPPSDKFEFSADQKTLTIGPVCKDNCTGGKDLMVIQCNASNNYGYALANGYINVFVRTQVVNRSPNVTLDIQTEVKFSVKATNDPNTPLTYTWYQERKDCANGWCKMFNVTDESLIMSDDGSELTIFNPQSPDATVYKCVVTNGISTDEAYFKLTLPPKAAYVWPYWWIPFIILLIVLIVIIIVCCVCCYLFRNRGDEYPVDEKERQADRNPEKELVDSGFHDYQRPEGMQISTLQRPAGRLGGFPGTPGSINSSLGKPTSEDEMSLNDYASLNAGKFTEDGSFIGQYNPSMKRSRPVATVTRAPWPQTDSQA